MRVVMLSKGRRPGAYRQGRERDLERRVALRLMAEGRAALVVPALLSSTAEIAGGHVYIYRRALLSIEPDLPGGRRRLRVFEADSEWTLAAEEAPLIGLLLDLGCACRALPRPRPRDTLVQMSQVVEVAGVSMAAGQVAALEFDPLSVLPELRDLGLYPWEVVRINTDEADSMPQGTELDRVRLVVHLEAPWMHPGAGSFLAGVHVDMSYGDYRLHPPLGEVRRAYAVRGRVRPPFGVLGH